MIANSIEATAKPRYVSVEVGLGNCRRLSEPGRAFFRRSASSDSLLWNVKPIFVPLRIFFLNQVALMLETCSLFVLSYKRNTKMEILS
jgi:hypothetical protein